jgi:hypothetical protein
MSDRQKKTIEAKATGKKQRTLWKSVDNVETRIANDSPYLSGAKRVGAQRVEGHAQSVSDAKS